MSELARNAYLVAALGFAALGALGFLLRAERGARWLSILAILQGAIILFALSSVVRRLAPGAQAEALYCLVFAGIVIMAALPERRRRSSE